MTERMLVGWDEIAAELHLRPRTAARKKKYLAQCGLIFELKFKAPGHTVARRRICSYPSLIRAHLVRHGKL